jgi:hypothetical protein
MNKIKLLSFALAILFGVFMFVYGEFDDSPGGQLIGLLAVIIGIIGLIRDKKKNSARQNSDVVQQGRVK